MSSPFPTFSWRYRRLQLRSKHALHALLHSIEILASGHKVLRLSTADGQVLGHDALLVHDVNASLLKALGELHQLWCAVQLATLRQTASPGEDGCDGVGGGRVALLVLTEVTRHGAVGSFGFEGLAVWGDEDRGHEAQGTEALGDNVGLHVAVVVLHGDQHATLALHHLSDHVVNEPVLVPDP